MLSFILCKLMVTYNKFERVQLQALIDQQYLESWFDVTNYKLVLYTITKQLYPFIHV